LVNQAAPQSPEWWRDRLHKQLVDRLPQLERYENYYCGEFKNPWVPEQYEPEFRRMLRLTRANMMGLVVDATAERCTVEGFRIGDEPEADQDTWRIWQANNLDSDSDQAILTALITGQSYLLVEPNADDQATPRIYVEDPSQAIVAYVPGTGRRQRAAGWKMWLDDWTGMLCGTVFLPPTDPGGPGWLYKYQATYREGSDLSRVRWEPREVAEEEWPAPNILGDVPLVEVPNNPRLLAGGISEIADVIGVQDRICKTLADRLMTQDYGAFPQKWAIGFPSEDDQGNAVEIPTQRDRMVTSDIADTRFGQWDAAPLDPYSAAKREDVKDIASRTRTPAQYLLGELTNVNGETLKAAESGLVSKVRQRMRPYGEAFETAMRLARKAAGLTTDADPAMETIWRNPEYRTEGELVDALVKMATLGVPREALWERWGATQVEISRWKKMAEDQAANDPLTQLAAAAAGG
jgi:hypothetical protein